MKLSEFKKRVFKDFRSQACYMVYSARMDAGLTQRALGELVGMKQSSIARIENFHVEPRLSILEKILRACGDKEVSFYIHPTNN